jgi:tetratricopeptide (TPR) repeat protein
LNLAGDLRSQYWVNHAIGGLASAYILSDDLEQAQSSLETIISSQTPMDTMGKRYCWVRRAELELAQGDATLALEIADRLITTAPGMGPGDVITFLWLLKGEVSAVLGRTEEAHTLLRAALDNARANEERFLLWRIHASLGRLYEATGHQAEASEEFIAASGIVEQLAASIDDDALKDNFLEGAKSSIRRLAG